MGYGATSPGAVRGEHSSTGSGCPGVVRIEHLAFGFGTDFSSAHWREANLLRWLGDEVSWHTADIGLWPSFADGAVNGVMLNGGALMRWAAPPRAHTGRATGR